MSVVTTHRPRHVARLTGLASSAVMIVACATAPQSPLGAADVRSRLTALQTHPDLAGRARIEVREAEVALRTAEQPLREEDRALALHRVYMADRRVSIAESRANLEHVEDERAGLSEEREAILLQARTREADRARDDAARARSDASRAREETAAARSLAASARDESADARKAEARAQAAEVEASALAARSAADYQRRIDELQAESTERGLVLTLGDVLFATGSAALQDGPNSNLDKLVKFLEQYPTHRVLVEGHTDNVGEADFNRGLSQRRADSVRSYLLQEGISAQSVTASGLGMGRPVASNATASGRQQNRRVEVIIEDPA